MNNLQKTMVWVAFLCFATTTFANIPTYSLSEAVKKKLVTIDIKGADGQNGSSSGHYGKCLQLKMSNASVQYFKVKLEAGQQLIPDDSTIQNMMVTEGAIFAFSPRTVREDYLNAMCVQKNDGAPQEEISFTMGEMSTGHLLGIAQLVEKYKYFNRTAQNAVWCISDGADINNITDDDSLMVKRLQDFVSAATGQKVGKREARKPVQHYEKHTITFEWGTSKTHTTTLVVLNSRNQPVMKIIDNEPLAAGHHRKEIILSTENLPKGNYKIVLYIDNRPQMTRRVKLGS